MPGIEPKAPLRALPLSYSPALHCFSSRHPQNLQLGLLSIVPGEKSLPLESETDPVIMPQVPLERSLRSEARCWTEGGPGVIRKVAIKNSGEVNRMLGYKENFCVADM